MWDRLLKNAHVVDPVNGINGIADVALEGGRIAAVGQDLQRQAEETENLTGLTVMPGLIDSHLHLGSVFGSPYGARMAALAGVTTCLDMAGPVADIIEWTPKTGAGINVAMLEGFSPKDRFGTMHPTSQEIARVVDEDLASGALGVKLMGGHWPLPVEVCQETVRLANEKEAYVAWHAGSETAGSNLLGMIEAVQAVKGMRLHLAHINAYCRGRVKDVLAEAQEAEALLIENPNIWSESYVSPMNGTILTCGEKGEVIDHVTQTCLKTFGLPPTADGLREAFRKGCLFAVRDTGSVSELVGGDEALRYWEEAGTKTAGSFPVNPALSRFYLAQAKRPDGTFVVDAISTDGGCIPRNVTISVGLSLVKFGAITLPEFVLKTSVNPARHLRLFDRGSLTPGAAADITVFDLDKQRAVETIVSGETVMKGGVLMGKSARFVTTQRGAAALQAKGFETIVVDFAGPEPERIRA